MIEWTKQQIELRDAIRAWKDALNAPCDHKDDRDIFLARWEVAKQMGVLSLPVSEEFGGLGQDVLATMYGLEAFGNICEDEGLSFGLSSHIVSTLIPIQRFGNDEQKRRYLPDLTSGNIIGAHAISETESGSDAWSMKTFAEKTATGYVLNGSKTFISNGPVADTFVVYARTHKNNGALGGFSAFILDKETEGFCIGKAIEKVGLQSSTLCDLYFDNVQLSDSQVLGKAGNGFSIFNYVMNWEILCSFIINVGEMERLLTKCINYSKSRKQYGEPIAKFQAISHKIADMKIRLETSRMMLYKAGYQFNKGRNITVDLSIAKVVTSENFVQCALDAMQIFGGYGFMQESGIDKYLRNSVGSKIYSGSSEVQRNTIASMLGL